MMCELHLSENWQEAQYRLMLGLELLENASWGRRAGKRGFLGKAGYWRGGRARARRGSRDSVRGAAR